VWFLRDDPARFGDGLLHFGPRDRGVAASTSPLESLMHASPDPLAVCEAAARAGGRILGEWVGRFKATVKGPRDFVTEADHASQREIRRIVLEAFPDHGFVGEEGDGSGPPLAIGRAGHSGSGIRWIVDPLDGTTNYVHGFPAYCVSIALAEGDDLLVAAIHDPLRDECFTARRGGGAFFNGQPLSTSTATEPADAVAAVSFPPHVASDSQSVADFLAVLPHVHAVRRTGSTALNLAYVASGRLHTFWARRIACWDAAAGLLIAREAGCAVGSFVGGPEVIPLDDPAFVVACSPQLFTAIRTLLG
jgi:myo-inositol-1(or 4)-monophosphatase